MDPAADDVTETRLDTDAGEAAAAPPPSASAAAAAGFVGSPSKSTVDGPNVPPSSMLRRPQFWLLWATFLVNSQSVVYINTQYKSFGLYLQLGDHFLAIVGSLAAVFNAGARVIWGYLHDRLAYRPLMFVLSFGMALLMGTFALSGSSWYYLVWVCLMFGTFAGNFALFPAACAKLYGQTNMTVNYGLLFTANATSGIVGALLTTILKDSIGWLGLFLLGAAFSVVGAVLTLLFEMAGRA